MTTYKIGGKCPKTDSNVYSVKNRTILSKIGRERQKFHEGIFKWIVVWKGGYRQKSDESVSNGSMASEVER